jgi:hypothetical protein
MRMHQQQFFLSISASGPTRFTDMITGLQQESLAIHHGGLPALHPEWDGRNLLPARNPGPDDQLFIYAN